MHISIMSENGDAADRYAASVTLFSGSIATAVLFAATDFVSVSNPVIIGALPVLVTGFVMSAILVVRRQM